VDHIKEQIDISNGQIIKSQVAKLKMEKDITKLKDSLSKHEKELGKLDNEIKQLKEKFYLYYSR
jgi:cell division protein FtsL